MLPQSAPVSESVASQSPDAALVAPRVQWLHVVVFYVLACAWSWPFFWWRDIESASFQAWRMPPILKTASYMWGPGLAALACFVIFRRTHRRTVTVLGERPWQSVLIWILPWIGLLILGGPSMEGMSLRMLVLLMLGLGLLTVFGEELGWRGFLEDALAPLSPWRRYALIGVLWELWHFTNRTAGRTFVQATLSVGIGIGFCIALSFLLGRAAVRTKSVLVAAMLHGVVNGFFEFAFWQAWVSMGVGTAIALLLVFLPRRRDQKKAL